MRHFVSCVANKAGISYQDELIFIDINYFLIISLFRLFRIRSFLLESDHSGVTITLFQYKFVAFSKCNHVVACDIRLCKISL